MDLTGRERHLRSAMSAMSLVAARFARAARRTLPFLVRQRARLVPQAVYLCAAGTESGAIDRPRFEVRLEADDGPAWGALSLDADALALLLESALGGGATDAAEPVGGELSLAQSALVARMARSLAADYSLAIQTEVGLALRVSALRSHRAGDTLDVPNVDGLAVDLGFGEISEAATITVTASAEALEAAARKRAGEVTAPAADPQMAEAVADVPVEVVAELGRVNLGLRQVLGLRPGQVLRLPTATDDSVVVRVAGLRKFDAVPVISRGQLSVQIKGRHEE